VRDSKELTPREREDAARRVRAAAAAVGVGVAEVAEVDAFNIRMASLLAMRRAVEALGLKPQGLIVDGKDLVYAECACEAVVDGDARSQSIAAASIIAKTTRDAMMDAEDAAYPLYGFAQNKGYGTPEHLSALRSHGPCAIHRRSFAPVKELLCVQEVMAFF
jgi:ribonuclease HII